MNESDWWRDLVGQDETVRDLDEAKSIGLVITGLLQGDLAPLATHLKAGYPLHLAIRRELVEAIERCPRPVLVRNSRGARSKLESVGLFLRNIQIADYYQERLKSARNAKTAFDETKASFGLERSAVRAALAGAKRWRAESERVLSSREPSG